VGEILNRLVAELQSSNFSAEQLELHRLRTDETAGLADQLALGEFYTLHLSGPCTISISAHSNEPYLNERDYLEDYGRDLDPAYIDSLVTIWRSAGYHFGITTMGGRPKGELEIFCYLAIAVAHACAGYVIVMEALGIPIGVYSPDDFRQLAESRVSSPQKPRNNDNRDQA
jgi:hypothetical protein